MHLVVNLDNKYSKLQVYNKFDKLSVPLNNDNL